MDSTHAIGNEIVDYEKFKTVTYAHFLEILLHFDFVMPSWVMLKLVVLASTKFPTTKSLSPFMLGSNCIFC